MLNLQALITQHLVVALLAEPQLKLFLD